MNRYRENKKRSQSEIYFYILPISIIFCTLFFLCSVYMFDHHRHHYNHRRFRFDIVHVCEWMWSSSNAYKCVSTDLQWVICNLLFIAHFDQSKEKKNSRYEKRVREKILIWANIDNRKIAFVKSRYRKTAPNFFCVTH